MKKTILLLATFAAFTGAIAQEQKQQSKTLKAEASIEEWSKQLNKLQAVNNYIQHTNLPHQDVVQISSTIDSLQMLIVPQLQQQLQKQDSAKENKYSQAAKRAAEQTNASAGH
jgi:hypothetical protein